MPPASDELALLVRAAQSEHRLPSVAAAVVVRGEHVLELALGVADDPMGRETTLDTQYRIGSITKTFTAAAVLALVEEGKVALDDPLGRHLPEAGDRPLTIRRLLTHSSGLQREPPGNVWETFAFPTMPELLARHGEAEQVLEPGVAWHYSNLAFSLLGEVVARAAGTPYERFVEERLLEPAGLRRTSWERSEPAAPGYFVDPYSGVLRPEHDLRRIDGVSAAGDLWSTVGDIVRWGAWLRGRGDMQAVQAMADEDHWLLGQGLGLLLKRRADRVFYGHDGGMPGYLATLVCSREEDVQACVLTNASTPGLQVTELGLGLAERAIELCPRPPELWRAHGPPPAGIQDLLGIWWSEGTQIVFSWRDGHVEAREVDSSPGVKPSVLEPEGPDRFRVTSGRERAERLEVVRDGAGRAVKLYWATYPVHARAAGLRLARLTSPRVTHGGNGRFPP